MKNEDLTITIKGENGEEIVCDVLFTFDSDVTEKSYIAYTDNTKDEAGNIKVYASIYDPDNLDELLPIEDEKEWNLVNKVLNEIQNEVRNSVNGENE